MTLLNRFWIFISDVLKCWSNMFCYLINWNIQGNRLVLLAGWLQVVSGLSSFNDFLQVFDNQHETCWLKASTLSLPGGGVNHHSRLLSHVSNDSRYDSRGELTHIRVTPRPRWPFCLTEQRGGLQLSGLPLRCQHCSRFQHRGLLISLTVRADVFLGISALTYFSNMFWNTQV